MNSQKEELQHKLTTLLNMETLKTVKISMLEAFRNQLKTLHLQSEKSSIHPCQSELQNPPSTIEFSIQQLQEKIMMKRAIKFQLNEELQGVEDELYEIEKVIETKRLCDDKMRREIDKKMLMIEWSQQKKSNSQSIVEKTSKNKTLGNISTKLKNIFG